MEAASLRHVADDEFRAERGDVPPPGPLPVSFARPAVLSQCAFEFRYAKEEFIEAVRLFPCLWNTGVKEYRDVRKKDEAWLEVVAAIKNKEISDTKAAKAEWKKLRDSHRDSLKRIKTKTGQAAEVTND